MWLLKPIKPHPPHPSPPPLREASHRPHPELAHIQVERALVYTSVENDQFQLIYLTPSTTPYPWTTPPYHPHDSYVVIKSYGQRLTRTALALHGRENLPSPPLRRRRWSRGGPRWCKLINNYTRCTRQYHYKSGTCLQSSTFYASILDVLCFSRGKFRVYI